MAFTVVYDACVLYPAPLRDLLLRIAGTEIVRERWTEAILRECFESILANRPDLTAERLARTRANMCEAIPDCLVSGYEPLMAELGLPDPEDHHVLAAAIRVGAQAIITFNLRDFPDHLLARYDVEAKHPDEFVLESLDLAPGAVIRCVLEQVESLSRPPQSVAQLLATLRNVGLARSAARLGDLMNEV